MSCRHPSLCEVLRAGRFAALAVLAALLLNGCYYAYETRTVGQRSLLNANHTVTSEVMDEQEIVSGGGAGAGGTVEHRTVQVFSETLNGKLVGRRVFLNGQPVESASASKYNQLTHSYERVNFTSFGTDATSAYEASRPENWLEKGYGQQQPEVRQLDRPLPMERAPALETAPRPATGPVVPPPDTRRLDVPTYPGGGGYKPP